ncbi:hypothetical protein ACFPYI_14480 [Halomarina salina]|uniref:Nudix hydrolase domain-containing protein n=1 Tax=Halomarina salina TaxID=1872699 RepID=A0ABD5RPW8_9EURY|nr:hypothetical protein [Halomarina salina]
MDRLPPFDALRADDAVTVAESTATHASDEFDYWTRLDGILVLGVLDTDGNVLLMDSSHGWRLPFVAVEGSDWASVARTSAEALTGVEVTVESVERVECVEHRPDDSADRVDSVTRTVTHDVVVRTTPVAEGSLAATPRLPDWGELTVDWFGAVPDDAYRDHDETVADIERMLD